MEDLKNKILEEYKNANVVASFMEHCKQEGIEIPDTIFESYFGA